MPVCVRTLDEDPVDDDLGPEHAARQVGGQLAGGFVRGSAGQLDEPTAKSGDVEIERPGSRIPFERVQQVVLETLVSLRGFFIVRGLKSAHRAFDTILVDVAQQPPGHESEEQPGTEAERPGECQAKRAHRFVIAPSQRPSHGSYVRAKLNPLNNVRTFPVYQRMTSDSGPYLTRETLIQSVIVAVVVLVGLLLFFAFGDSPRPLLDSDLPGFG